MPKNQDNDSTLEERRRGFARLMDVLLWLFAIGATIGALQVARALWSGALWVNYKGEVVTRPEMWRELTFFALVAIACAPLAWYWRRAWRRPP